MVRTPSRLCFQLLSICVLVLSPAGLDRAVAQSSEDQSGNRTVAVFVSVAPPGSLAGDAIEFLRTGLLTSLSSSLEGYSFIPQSGEEPERRDARAAAAGADAWIAVILAPEVANVRVELSVRDLYYEDPGTGLIYHIPLTSSFRGNTGGYWFPAVDLVESRLLSPDYEALVSISGSPGTIVTGLSEAAVVLDGEGKGQTRIPFGETMRFEARAEGFHSVEGTIRATAAELDLLLDQPVRGRLSYDLYLTGFSYPGGGLSFHLTPAWNLIRLDLFTYALGFIPYANVGGERGRLFASEPVSHATVSVLQHLVSPENPIRPYIGIGATARLLHAGGTIRREPIAPYGATALLGAELPRRYGAWFFEYAPLFYFVEEPELWDSQFSRWQPGYVRLGDNVLDVMMIRIGFRFTPPGRK
jgi:hypothetical protein